MNVLDGIYFKNRRDAGEKLGLYLESKYKDTNPLIIGIPRGGVEVAYYVARRLHAEFSLIISKKLPFPTQKELGFGAVAEENTIYVAPMGTEHLKPEVINQIIEEQVDEIHRRIELYRQGKPLPDMKGRTVILVDDGIATGVTLVPVVMLCRKKEAAKIIIAAPVSGSRYDNHLKEADAIEVLIQPPSFFAVGQVYESFGDLTDKEMQEILSKAAITDFTAADKKKMEKRLQERIK